MDHFPQNNLLFILFIQLYLFFKKINFQVGGSRMAFRPNLVNKQFNSPIKLYSPENVADALEKQKQILANGAVG